MSAEKVHFHASDGVRLEALWQAPADARPGPAVIIAHSHALLAGGHMHTHLLRALSAALLAHGIAALRLNFRGVQGSAGAFDDGRGELHDLAGAVDVAAAHRGVDPDRLALAGYSFGSRVALPYALTDPRIKAVATLGFPARRFVQSTLDLHIPVLLLAGEADTTTPLHYIEQFHARHPTTTLHVMPGANHHFHGEEPQAAEAVAQFFQLHL
ncbi:MAG: dienelactone hydrolase family protein [Chloroflexi bacterium]|nr:dienelactone hydrolase family protein [Chloroflexota bacterium]